MHTTKHSEESVKKIKEALKLWKESEGYVDYIERQRERGRRSKTKFKKGHKSFTDGSNLKGLQAGKSHWKWNGGRYIAQGYFLIWMPEHPNSSKNGYIQEHRLIMEKKLGRYLTKSEIVHHINGNKLDNNVSNLLLLTRSEHATLHLKERYAKKS